MRTLWIQTALIAALGALHAGEAVAQTYPDRPVRLVVPYAPGGGADIHARLVAAHLATALGQQVLVENRPGAGSNLGTEHVARSAPDGYTLLVSSTATAVNQSMYRKLPFNVLKDFDSVSVLATVPLVVAVHPSVPAQTIPELVALAKSKPGVLNYASGGVGTANHLGGELFKLLASVDIAHVAYKGGGPALNDLLAGHVQMLFGTVSSTYPLVKAGRLRGLATTGPKRSSAAPDLPTVIEAGLPGYEVTAWYGVLAPTGTPRPILERLAREIDRIVQLPDIQTAFQKQGSEAVGGTTEVASRFLHREVETWEKVVKASNMTAE
jgi:tripartite-type tricarboxylate transporter receptor subunit TctC